MLFRSRNGSYNLPRNGGRNGPRNRLRASQLRAAEAEVGRLRAALGEQQEQFCRAEATLQQERAAGREAGARAAAQVRTEGARAARAWSRGGLR